MNSCLFNTTETNKNNINRKTHLLLLSDLIHREKELKKLNKFYDIDSINDILGPVGRYMHQCKKTDAYDIIDEADILAKDSINKRYVLAVAAPINFVKTNKLRFNQTFSRILEGLQQDIPVFFISEPGCHLYYIWLDYSPDFSIEEFNLSKSVNGLCVALSTDIGKLALRAPDNTINWLNSLLQKKDLYQAFTEKRNGQKYSQKANALFEKINELSEKKLNAELQLTTKKLNRLIIEENYLTLSPKLPKLNYECPNTRTTTFNCLIKNSGFCEWHSKGDAAESLKYVMQEMADITKQNCLPIFSLSSFIDYCISEHHLLDRRINRNKAELNKTQIQATGKNSLRQNIEKLPPEEKVILKALFDFPEDDANG